MTNWRRIAEAHNIRLSPENIKQTESSLAALERAFVPLQARLEPEIEPAVILSEAAVEGQ